MNNILYWMFLVIICFLMGCNKNKDCKCRDSIIAADKYSYPVKSGSSEWNAAGAWGIGRTNPLDSIYKLCQIPPTKLQAMSTMGLIQSLLDNPCLLNMLLRNDKFQGRNEVLAQLNVSRALDLRPDAGISIVNYYEAKDPNCAGCLNTDDERGDFANNWYLLDMVCTQYSILNQLDRQTKKSFSKMIIDKFKTQLNYPSVFGSSRTSSVLILSQIMILEGFQPYLDALQANSRLYIFASTGELTGDFYSLIIDFSTKYINS